MQCSTELTPGHSLSVSCYCTPCTNTNQHFHSRAQSLAEYELCWIATLLELQNTKYWFDFQRWEIILWSCGGGGCWLWHWWSWFSVSTPLQGRAVTKHVKPRKREKCWSSSCSDNHLIRCLGIPVGGVGCWFRDLIFPSRTSNHRSWFINYLDFNFRIFLFSMDRYNAPRRHCNRLVSFGATSLWRLNTLWLYALSGFLLSWHCIGSGIMKVQVHSCIALILNIEMQSYFLQVRYVCHQHLLGAPHQGTTWTFLPSLVSPDSLIPLVVRMGWAFRMPSWLVRSVLNLNTITQLVMRVIGLLNEYTIFQWQSIFVKTYNWKDLMYKPRN